MHPVIRKFEPRDAEPVAQIAQQSPEAAAWSLRVYQQLNHSKEHFAWVTEYGGAVCSFLVARTLGDDEAEILNLAVAPTSRRAGHATALLQICLAEFAQRQIQRVFLEVRESNLPAISFYEKHGFVRTGRRPGYYQNPIEAAVLLVRKLTG
jgi:ribosomal-protein-alanine N-acetyltransferase